MDDHLRAHRDASLMLLDQLIRRGRALSDGIGIRVWQQDCAAAINELSGGSKAHWLSRAFSGALLVRSTNGGAMIEASVAEIVDRIVDVLKQARASLTQMDSVTTNPDAPPLQRRFDFVRNADLRPVLEQAYAESGGALEAGDVHRALTTACSILEAIITDALERRSGKASAERLADMTFDARIAAAERDGLIRGGCARLPRVARTYRDLLPDVTISERDAKVARQVLHVVMRDLDPGR